MEIQDRLDKLRERIALSAVRSGRRPEDITLLAVTKTLPVETLQAAYQAGLRIFGENRVQEALEKIGILPNDISWHLIGRLQTNKINKIMGKFSLIHSVDSLELARALSARLEGSSQDVLLEVNSSGESSKAGVAPETGEWVAEKIAALPGLRLRGLMTVGPLSPETDGPRRAFRGLKVLFDGIRRKEWAGPSFTVLSMGMSGDFEAAIEEGSTLVRIGTALFGPRG